MAEQSKTTIVRQSNDKCMVRKLQTPVSPVINTDNTDIIQRNIDRYIQSVHKNLIQDFIDHVLDQ